MAAPKQQQHEEGNLHALAFPFPIPGHINPFTSFSHTIASLGITVTLVHTQFNRLRLPDKPPIPPNMHVIDIPDGLPLDFDRVANHDTFFVSIQQMGGAFEQLLEKVHRSSPVSCIISDPSFPWVQNVANKFNIPLFLFVADAAAVFSISLHAHRLVADGFLGEGSPKDPSKLVDFIPGIPPLHPDYLPFPKPQDHEFFTFFFLKLRVSLYDRISEVAGVLLNTFYELERDALDGASAHISIPIFPVGPSLLESILTVDVSSRNELNAGLSSEEACMQWLDGQSPSSVMYVSFGSLAKLTESQVEEIAEGLKASGQPFLWVVRSPTDLLLQNFSTQTKGRGLVVCWAPQLKVLAHPAVGAFMTHCGWNSTLECVIAGVPMLCCPQFLDQGTNCRLIVDQWKVGVELERGQGSGSVDRLVRLLLLEEEGKAMKTRAMELRDAAKQAVCAAPAGSSFRNLQAFRQLLTAIDRHK